MLPRMRVARAHKDGGVLRWSSSIALALALHVLAIVLLFGNDQAEEPSASLPAPILLDLFAVPMEPDIARADSAPRFAMQNQRLRMKPTMSLVACMVSAAMARARSAPSTRTLST